MCTTGEHRFRGARMDLRRGRNAGYALEKRARAPTVGSEFRGSRHRIDPPFDTLHESTPASPSFGNAAATEAPIMMNRRHLLTISILVSGPCLSAPVARADYQANMYTDPATNEVLQYNLFVPNNYDPATKYPLLVFLHAAGTAAQLPRTLAADGMGWVGVVFATTANQAMYPSFFLIPISQTNDSGWGDPTAPITDPEKFEGRLTIVVLKQLLASGKYNIDPDRLYVTGPSMGGRGTWDMLRRYPGLFAAAAPSNAPASTADAALYVNQNIWAICGDMDPIAQGNTDIVNAIRAAGGNPIYTEKANDGHDTWRTIYPDPQFMAWMYAQKLGVPWWTVSKAPTFTGLVGPDVVAPANLGTTFNLDGGSGLLSGLDGGGGTGGSSGAVKGGSGGSSGAGPSSSGGSGSGAGAGSGSSGASASSGAASSGGSSGAAGSSGAGAASSSGTGGAGAGAAGGPSATPVAGGGSGSGGGAGSSSGAAANSGAQAPAGAGGGSGGATAPSEPSAVHSSGGGGCSQTRSGAAPTSFASTLGLLVGLIGLRRRYRLGGRPENARR